MSIINNALGQSQAIPAQRPPASNQAGTAAASDAGGQVPTSGNQVSANRADSELIQRLNISSVETSEQSLESANARFQSGELLTREAAENVASAILD